MQRSTTPDRRFQLSLGFAVVAGAALGAFRISRQSLWYDELFSISLADASWGDMWKQASDHELHSGAYHVASWFWIRVFGDSEAGLRSLSVAFGIAATVALMVLAKKLFNTRVALLTAPLFLLHAQTIRYFQEGRTYSFAMFAATAVTLAFCWAMDDRSSTRRWFVYGLGAGMASYGHLFVWFVLVAHAVTVILRRAWPGLRQLVVSVSAFVVVASPLFLFTTKGYENIAWIAPTTFASARTFVVTMILGGGSAKWLIPLVGLWLFRLWWSRDDERELFAATLAWCWIVVPIALAVVVSIWKPLFEPHYLNVCVPACALLTAAGVDALIRRWRVFTALVFAVVLAHSAFLLREWFRGFPQKDDYRSAMPYACAQAGDTGSLVFEPAVIEVAFYYAPAHCGVPNSERVRVFVVRHVGLPKPAIDGWTTTARGEFANVTVYTLTKN